MRKRMLLAMMALVLFLFPTGMLLVSRQSFALMLERERTRALSEEAAIARSLTVEIGEDTYSAHQQAAQGLQQKYGSGTLQLALLYRGTPMAGAQLPAEAAALLSSASARATLLDKSTRCLYIAHRLDDDYTLLLTSDVSPVYDLQKQLLWWTGGLTFIALLAAFVAAYFISLRLSRSLRALAKAADALASGQQAPLPPPHRRDEVGRLSQAFSQMSQAVQEREKALTEQAQRQQAMIDAMAHEMRTPLTAIVSSCRMLQLARLTKEQQAALLTTLTAEAQRLSTMDERLLSLTRLRTDPPEMKPLSLRKMAEQALAIFENVVLAGNDSVISGNEELLIELLRNLVVNAQRAGGTAPITVTLQKNGFTVTDHGCGMTAQQLANAFEPFYKADKARTRLHGGAGLGLTLCRQIALLHGGALHIESQVGAGTSVSFTVDQLLTSA